MDKGLEWLTKNQSKDGHWEAFGGQYPLTMTGLSGMAMLMQGSTIREGKYKDNIRRAVDWLMARSMPNGMIGNPNIPGEAGRYMYGHGFALLFLSCVYGEEEEGERRRKLEDILTRAAKFTRDAQTQRESTRYKDKNGKPLKLGGWGYVSAKEGNNFDEGSVTITQVQALRAARNAGIAVPPDAIKEAVNYLQESTNDQGGVIYSLAGGGGGEGRPALTAAAISCGFSAGEYNSPLVKKWLKFAKTAVQPVGDVPLRPRRVHPLLLRPGDLHSRRRRLRQALPRVEGGRPAQLEQVPGQHVPEAQGPAERRRQLDRRPRRPVVHHRRPPVHPATGQRLFADLPTMTPATVSASAAQDSAVRLQLRRADGSPLANLTSRRRDPA